MRTDQHRLYYSQQGSSRHEFVFYVPLHVNNLQRIEGTTSFCMTNSTHLAEKGLPVQGNA